MLTEEHFDLFRKFRIRAMGDKLREMIDDPAYDDMTFEDKMAVAFFDIGAKGKLRNRQNLAVNIQNRTVHFLVFIGEHPQIGGFARQNFGVGIGVTCLHADQNHIALAHLADGFAVHGHLCVFYALYNCFHFVYLSTLSTPSTFSMREITFFRWSTLLTVTVI